jgi:serine/threonine-protein kinase RsbW
MSARRQEGPVELVIPSDLEEVPRVQAEIAKQLKAKRFNQHDIFGVRLALEEALVNAIKHGNRLDRRKKVRIHYHIRHGRFDIDIADEGPGFNPKHVADPLAPENIELPGGRGLLLMRHYMTEVEFHPPGNRVTMAKVKQRASRNGK